MRAVAFFQLLLISAFLSAQEVRIGLYGTQPISNIIITPSKGEYKVFADGKMIAFLDVETVLQVISTKDSLIIKINNGKEIHGSKILVHSQDSSHFKIRAVSPDVPVKNFFGAVEVTAIKSGLRIVNVTDLEVYIAGVVESEVGSKAPNEYYKSQAILCRTYALSHYRRHETEGFQLCDRVHCQAYKSRSVRNPAILEAVRRTKGLVLVDDKLELITAAFHSNCGGQTANSEDVWNKNVSYLRSVRDTFCIHEPNARWVKEIPAEKWINHLENVCSYPVQDSSYSRLICSVEPLSRITYLGDERHAIPTRELRTDFNLKSAYFGVSKVDDKIMLKGKGYGHGVGLCQEGAMRMARLGYSYSKILHFYYTGVNIVNLNELEFFRHE
jgi:stage II sporulation protein D